MARGSPLASRMAFADDLCVCMIDSGVALAFALAFRHRCQVRLGDSPLPQASGNQLGGLTIHARAQALVPHGLWCSQEWIMLSTRWEESCDPLISMSPRPSYVRWRPLLLRSLSIMQGMPIGDQTCMITLMQCQGPDGLMSVLIRPLVEPLRVCLSSFKFWYVRCCHGYMGLDTCCGSVAQR